MSAPNEASPPLSAASPVLPSEAGPVAERSRLPALDVCRGIALLGIFFVNASLFGEPFADVVNGSGPGDEGRASTIVYWLTNALCAGKFYPLFSILFGAGLAIMVDSSRAAQRSFHLVFFRRLVILALVGVLHIVLLWPGDILLIYAGVGLWMLLLGTRRPRTLFIVAGVLFVIGIAGTYGLSRLAQLGQAFDATHPTGDPGAAATGTPFERWWTIMSSSPELAADPRLRELEVTIIGKGPFLPTVVVRLANYTVNLYWVVFQAFWQILACFCTGAGLYKIGFFHGTYRGLRKVFIGLGLLVGLPLNVYYALDSSSADSIWSAISQMAMQAGGPLMSLMYLSLVMLWTDSQVARPAQQALSRLGRMGLTGYLLESLLMSAVMLHWGLGRFGTTTWTERAVYVVAIYLVILLLANLWMSALRIGPLEWLWRCGTYWKWQPLRKGAEVPR